MVVAKFESSGHPFQFSLPRLHSQHQRNLKRPASKRRILRSPSKLPDSSFLLKSPSLDAGLGSRVSGFGCQVPVSDFSSDLVIILGVRVPATCNLRPETRNLTPETR